MLVQVALYSGHPVSFAGLAAAIKQFASMELQLLPEWNVQQHESWISTFHAVKPDVVLIDVQSFVPYGLLTELRQVSPNVRIVLWVTKVYMQMAKHAIDLGVRGILSKDAKLPLLVRCLQRVAAGELWFERKLTDQLLGSTSIRLSNREMQLLTLVTQGLSNKEIAHILGLTEGTVKHYFSRLFRKCDVNDRLELVFYGMRNLFGESIEGPWSNTNWEGERWPNTMVSDRTAVNFGS